jgi:GntR family transcriptional regulator
MDVPAINRRSAVPPHRQIAAWLRARIEAGEFDPPGEIPLPSQKDLMGLFGAARDTARRAVQVLRDEGWSPSRSVCPGQPMSAAPAQAGVMGGGRAGL